MVGEELFTVYIERHPTTDERETHTQLDHKALDLSDEGALELILVDTTSQAEKLEVVVLMNDLLDHLQRKVDTAIRRAQRHQHAAGRWSDWSHVFLFEGKRLDGQHWVLESDIQLQSKNFQLGAQENRSAKYFDEAMFPTLAVLDFGLSETQITTLLCEGLELVANRERYSIRELVGTLIAAGLYVCISIVPMFLIPQTQLAASSAPFADLFAQRLGGQWGGWIAAFCAISGLGALNGWTLVIGEVTQSMARHGGFPQALAHENSHAAPARAFVLSGIVTSVMLLMNYVGSVGSVFAFFSVAATVLTLPLYVLDPLAVLRLRRAGDTPRRVGPVTAAAAILAVVYCVWIVWGVEAKPLIWGTLLGVAGIPVYFVCTRTQRQRAPAST